MSVTGNGGANPPDEPRPDTANRLGGDASPYPRYAKRRETLWIPVLLASLCTVAHAESAVETAGFYKHLLSATDVADNYGRLGLTDEDIAVDNAQRIRLKFDAGLTEQLSTRVHYELRSLWGESLSIRNQMPEMVPTIHEAPPRFLDLESTLEEQSGYRLDHGLDRLQLRWQTDALDATVGRQAVSWGSGLVWAPTDLFSGFSPTEIDRDEKTGVDVVRTIWYLSLDSSVDVIGEPLDPDGPYGLDPDASSLVARFTSRVGEYDVAMLGGVVAGDTVIGGDFSGYLANAGFRGEAIHTWVDESDQRDYARVLVGIDYGFARAWNPYLALEYLYNGLGAGDADDYVTRLGESSVQRAFSRGNAFNLGRNYLATVIRVAPTALTSLSATTLVNLNDGSLVEYIAGVWSVTDSIDLLLGANLGFGDSGTEFGGYSVDQLGVEFRQPDFVFGYLKYYF